MRTGRHRLVEIARLQAADRIDGHRQSLRQVAEGDPAEPRDSPAELGARTVEILEASYRSAASGVLESVKTLDRQPA